MLLPRDDAAARLAAIVASADDAIISKDLDGTITSWNGAAERMFGFSADEAVGRSIHIIIPDDRRDEEDFLLARIKSGTGIDHFETIGTGKDGRRIEISLTISPIRDASGTVIGASRIARDISERRRMQRDAMRLAAIVESSTDAIIGKDLNGVIQTWNKGAERLFGYAADEAIGKPILMLIPEDRHDEETRVLSRIRAGQSERFDTIRRRKNGELIEISLTVSPIISASGQIVGASKIARDISDQRRLIRELEQANRAKDEFLAVLSHELRTPLNTVLGYTSILKAQALSTEQQDKALDVISRNADALTQLVNDVLDTSKIITGKIRLDLKLCDVGAITAEAVDAVRPTCMVKGLSLTTDIAEGQMVQGDPDRIRQILWNLLTNAVKFTPPDGRITVTVRPVEKAVRVAVQDSGVGLPADAIPFLFHRFWQADASGTREQGGLGLGLALARHFVELHGGRILASSEGPGKGATFEFYLPAAQLPSV